MFEPATHRYQDMGNEQISPRNPRIVILTTEWKGPFLQLSGKGGFRVAGSSVESGHRSKSGEERERERRPPRQFLYGGNIGSDPVSRI